MVKHKFDDSAFHGCAVREDGGSVKGEAHED